MDATSSKKTGFVLIALKNRPLRTDTVGMTALPKLNLWLWNFQYRFELVRLLL
jgi:hypothetical protein